MKPRDVIALVFAFGEEERFSLPVLGIPAYERVIRALRRSGIERVFLLTDIPELRFAAEGGSIDLLDPGDGPGDGALLGLTGDLPLITPGSIGSLIERFDPADGPLRADRAPIVLTDDYGLLEPLGRGATDFEPVGSGFSLPSDETERLTGTRDLPRIEAIARRRKIGSLLDSGVSIVDPDRTYVDEDVSVGEGTVLFPGIHLRGATRIGRGCAIGPDSFIEDSLVDDRSTVRYSVIEGSRVREGCSIGPYAHLRPGSAGG